MVFLSLSHLNLRERKQITCLKIRNQREKVGGGRRGKFMLRSLIFKFNFAILAPGSVLAIIFSEQFSKLVFIF